MESEIFLCPKPLKIRFVWTDDWKWNICLHNKMLSEFLANIWKGSINFQLLFFFNDEKICSVVCLSEVKYTDFSQFTNIFFNGKCLWGTIFTNHNHIGFLGSLDLKSSWDVDEIYYFRLLLFLFFFSVFSFNHFCENIILNLPMQWLWPRDLSFVKKTATKLTSELDHLWIKHYYYY